MPSAVALTTNGDVSMSQVLSETQTERKMGKRESQRIRSLTLTPQQIVSFDTHTRRRSIYSYRWNFFHDVADLGFTFSVSTNWHFCRFKWSKIDVKALEKNTPALGLRSVLDSSQAKAFAVVW